MRPSNRDDRADLVCLAPVRCPRIVYGEVPGACIYGYPAKGGIYVLEQVLGVEIEFLGFDRCNASKASVGHDASEEEHCNKMRRLGAKWWPSQYEYDEDSVSGYPPLERGRYMLVGWPAGSGVWVLNTTIATARSIGAGSIHNAFSMEERCQAIERLGGVFYANPRDCPDLDLSS